MKTRWIAVLACVAGLVTACSDTDDDSWRPEAAKSACEDSVKAQLKDADSAQFRDVTATDNGNGTYKVTGQVNARNSFGGMVGYTAFVCSARDSGDSVTGNAQIMR